MLRVAVSGRTEPVACSPGSARRTGRGLYTDGTPARNTALDLDEPLSVAAASDGGLLLSTGEHIALLPPLGGGRRLGAALPAANLERVPRGWVVVDLTHEADVTVAVARRGRSATTLRAHLPQGRSRLRLPRRLGRGKYRLTLTARASGNRVAIDRLAVLGRHRLDLPVVRRALNGYDLGETGLGSTRCQRRSNLTATCRAKIYDVCCAIDRIRVRVRLRRDRLPSRPAAWSSAPRSWDSIERPRCVMTARRAGDVDGWFLRRYQAEAPLPKGSAQRVRLPPVARLLALDDSAEPGDLRCGPPDVLNGEIEVNRRPVSGE